MVKDKLKDPADAGKADREEAKAKEGQEQVSFNRLKLSDFKAIPKRAARTPHPFQGYPEKKVKVGTYKEKGKDMDLVINATYLVALIPGTHDAPQDPSNEETGIRNTRNVVVSYAGRALNIVFDREMELEDGQRVFYALVPDPIYRAQVVFGWDPQTEQIVVHDQYLLLDDGQFSRLRQVFQMVLNPKLKVERISKAISGESAESLDELKSLSDEVTDGSN